MWTYEKQGKLTNTIFYSLLIAISLTLLSFFKTFVSLNELAYNFAERYNPKPQAMKVLLVEAPPETHEQGDDTWLTLLNILEEKNAKQVVFTFMPSAVSNDFYCRAMQYGNVFFARRLRHFEPALIDKNWESHYNCTDITFKKPIFGLTDVPPHSFLGIHSQQHSAFQVDGQTRPALEMLAAQYFLGAPLIEKTDAPYRVNFGGIDSLPQIKLERIIAGDLVSELVQERSVIVGFARESLGLHTPLTTISIPKYHALALNTLLSDEQVKIPDIKITFLLLLALMITNVILYRWLTERGSFRLTLFFIGDYIALTWLLYHYAHFALPIGEMIIAQVLLYWIDLKNKAFQAAETFLQETLIETSFKINESVKSNFTTDEYWSQIIIMVNDILELNRQIILEWSPGHNKIEEIKTLNCSLTEIKKRHYNKKPYTTAIKQAIHLKQPLLNPLDVAEEQYLVPLLFSGEPFGFWILTIESVKLVDKKQFEESINDLAHQMGQSLYYREQSLLRTQEDKNRLNRYIRFKKHQVDKILDNSIITLKNRLSVLEHIMDGLETAIIIYDVFGTVLLVNKRMNALSETFGLNIHKMNILGFMMTVKKVDIETARQYIRYVLLDQEKIVKQVKLTDPIERHLILDMQLFYDQEMVEDSESKVKQGILCQLVDVTQKKLQSTLKEKVAERLIFRSRNDMQSILSASQLLSREQSTKQEQRMVAGILQGKVNGYLKILKEVEAQLKVKMDTTKTTNIDTYPVDAKEPVLEAIEELAELAMKRQVKLPPSSGLPALLSLVFAAPNELSLVIASIFTLLIDDAVSNTEITLKIEERNEKMTYTFKNVGFGIPNKRFKKYLFSNEIDVSEQFKEIRRAIRVVKLWGGTLKAESQVGTGMSFELCLRSFI
jgi:hypothetical protein